MEKIYDREIQAKLRILKKDFDENEHQMRKAAIKYEDLMAKKDSLLTAIAELKKARSERSRQAAA